MERKVVRNNWRNCKLAIKIKLLKLKCMKSTKAYVKRFELDKSDNSFSHSIFAEWLEEDFIGLIEEMKRMSDFDLRQFNYCVKEIKKKWDSINNKTIGNLPEKLWNYFYAQVISKKKDELFPEVKKQKDIIFHFSNPELVEYLRDNGVPVHGIGRFDYVSEMDLRHAQNYLAGFDEVEMEYEVVKYALSVYIGRLKSILGKIKAKREESERKARERAEEQWRRFESYRSNKGHQNFEDFFDRFFGFGNGAFNNFFNLFYENYVFIPTKSFNLLGFKTNVEDVTVDDIKKAYRSLAMQHHPDKGGKHEDFIAITVAKDECMSYLEKSKA